MYNQFISYARKHSLKRVYVNILASQIASIKIVEKTGFSRKGKDFEQAKGMKAQTYEKFLKHARAETSSFSCLLISYIILIQKRFYVAIGELNYCARIRRQEGIRWRKKESGFRRISDDAVRAKTGKGWEEWYRILDTWGAVEKGHTKSAKYLHEQYRLSSWWAQAVTIRYDWERGLRK